MRVELRLVGSDYEFNFEREYQDYPSYTIDTDEALVIGKLLEQVVDDAHAVLDRE